MGNAGNITGWITFFIGLYAIAAGIGEFRHPGSWARMVTEVERSKALQFLIGLFVLTLGATIFLVNPFNPADWLSILVTVLGAFMIAEGLLVLSFGDWFLRFSRMLMGGSAKINGGLAVLIGIAALFVGLVRLQS